MLVSTDGGYIWLRPLHRETIMKKAIALILVALAVTSCSQTEKGAAIGAAGGAILGGAITGDVRGAALVRPSVV